MASSRRPTSTLHAALVRSLLKPVASARWALRASALPAALVLSLFIQAFCPVPLRAQEAVGDGVLLAVFAHPDDEGLVGPMLARYAREGVEVVLVTATDGRLGANEHSGIPAGDRLAAVRREELQCAAAALGVELIHLDYEDQFRAGEGYDGFIPQLQGLIRDLHRIVNERQPDAIVTFGPDGVTNHMDHRLVGSSVTQVLVSQDWEDAPDVYYVGLPASSMPESERVLRGVQEEYLTARIPYSDEDRDAALEAMRCHESQFPPEAMEDIQNEFLGRENITYLRPFVAPSGRTTDLFGDAPEE